jgi:HlyD family secretion protein
MSAEAQKQSTALVPARPVEIVERRTAMVSEFQPDAVALEERPPARLAFATLYLLTFLIAATVFWASVSHVDKIVVSRGKLINTKPNLVVQPLETSVIRSIDVSVGDSVKKGQQLALLDATFTKSDVGQLEAKSNAFESRMARLEAELAGKDFPLKDTARADEILEVRVFQQRKAFYDAQVRNFEEAVSRADANLATSISERDVLRQRFDRVKEIENMRAELIARQSGSRLNLLVSEDARLSVEASLAKLDGSIVELRHAIEKAQAERQAFIEEFRRTSIEQLVETRNLHTAAAEELKKASLRQSMVVLTAPADAVVLDAAQRSIGSVVREAEPLFTLVPLDVPIEAEVNIEARDIGLVSIGQPVRVKFDAFPYQEFGTASGKLRTISSDAFSPELSADRKDPSASLFFRARVELTDVKLRNVPDVRLIPGMSVAAEIKSGDRSVISYFLYPLLRGLNESIREP